MDSEDQVSTDTKLNCSFCGKSQDDVRKLIAGPKVYICDECIDRCNDILERDADSESPQRSPHPIQPIASCSLCKLPKEATELRIVAEKSALCLECIDAVRSVIDASEDPNDAP